MKETQVLVGMSGGVDSSVAAALLLEQGYRVTGVTMQTYGGELGEERLGEQAHEPAAKRDGAPGALALRRGCPSADGRAVAFHGCYGPGEAQEIALARQVAARLGIDHHLLDVREAYRHEVLVNYRREYEAGRTPNPCVRCNRTIKFGALWDAAQAAGLGARYFATGHYARVRTEPASGRRQLLRGRDRAKDQSYFLSALGQDQLARCLFPLGEFTKAEVRARAAALGLGVEEEPESQDFAAGLHEAFFGATARPGPIVDAHGRRLGTHRGIPFYTIGQRRGLGIAAAHPLYVTAIDPRTNQIMVGPKQDILSAGLRAERVNWVSRPRPVGPIRVQAQIRYRHVSAPAEAVSTEQGGLELRFEEPQLAITPGQTVVLYDGDLLLGGGVIAEALD